MKGRKNPLFLIIMMALPVWPGAATAQSETSDPFKNGVGIACKNKKPQFPDDHLFFLFTDNRKLVARLMFDNDAIARGQTLRTDIRPETISWLDREGFSNTRYSLHRDTLELSSFPGKYACTAMSVENINDLAVAHLANMLKNKKI
jgi:hypothetical protein